MLIGACRSQGAGAPGTARLVSTPTAVLSAAIPLVATSLKAALQTAVTLPLATIVQVVTLLMAIWPPAIPLVVTLEVVSLTWASPPLDSLPLDTMLAAKPGEGVPPQP